jgi:hypothetical protein
MDAAQGRYYELYTKQHGVESNLFLAPGEADRVEAAEDRAAKDAEDIGVADALGIVSGKTS